MEEMHTTIIIQDIALASTYYQWCLENLGSVEHPINILKGFGNKKYKFVENSDVWELTIYSKADYALFRLSN